MRWCKESQRYFITTKINIPGSSGITTSEFLKRNLGSHLPDGKKDSMTTRCLGGAMHSKERGHRDEESLALVYFIVASAYTWPYCHENPGRAAEITRGWGEGG